MRDEAGVALILVAVTLTGLLAVAGLSIDGSRAYAARRQVQNAADAAALAGAQALFSYQYGIATSANPTPTNNVNAAVAAKLDQNQTTTGHLCNFVQADGVTPAGSCSSTPPNSAAGVQVSGTNTQNTTFMANSGIKQFTARGRATAVLQPLVGTAAAPFIICGSPSDSWPILNADGTINIAAAVQAGSQPVQAAQVARCGAGASFKGKAADGQGNITVGTQEPGGNGNGFVGSIHDTVAGLVPCPSAGPFDGCDMIVPIADSGYGNGKGNIFLHIAAFGVFHITGDGHGNPKYTGYFEAPAALATGGIGGVSQQCTVGTQLCVVKLTS